MVFLIISWVFLLVAAAIGILDLKKYHTTRKRALGSSADLSTLSEREKVIIYDLEREHQKRQLTAFD